ncbi:hypothetical protein GJ700_23095 [Duganella sp. FT92W]|uniref:Cellulose biosynthesis protein BcsS n=1 Tax=Pseudoduganella rivuli TaxID=2666085 RepID=A0A7X2IRH8_9BURK|nr:hypothetical protein [Pseudoduganella rivuli]MRV74600.1 hypothetical protein [Pseudoduganella rivuli]
MQGCRTWKMRSAFATSLLMCAGVAPAVWAARPLVTDDAPILDPGQCQLETWVQREPTHTHYWVVPACNFHGDWELAAGAARIQARDGGLGMNQAVLQAKTLLAAPKDAPWRVGLVVADQFEPANGLAGVWSVYAPLTVDLNGDRLQWHTNVGWRRERHERPAATWATALEVAVGERSALTVESYGVRGGGAWRQLGVRYALVPGRADADIAWGEKSGSGRRERYYAAGLTIYTGGP